jgi:hypothetical protein
MSALNGMPALQYASGVGVATPYGVLLPPGSRIAAFVRGTNGVLNQNGLDASFQTQNLSPTLAAAANKVRAGYGDTIVCLPGHTENFAVADAVPNLLAGTRIIGVGTGGQAPTFRWTANAATFLLNVADVTLSGLRLRMEGNTAVAAPITVSAADCAIVDCDIETSSGASNLATVPITVAAGAHRFKFLSNFVRGALAGVSTDGILISGAAEDVLISGNDMAFATTAANGLIRVTADALRLRIRNNELYATVGSSLNTIVFNSAAITASVSYNNSYVVTNGTPPAGGILVTSAGYVGGNQNFTVDGSGLSGFLDPTMST